MNIKIAKTLLILNIVYIVAFYIIKFAFPDFLLLQITDPNVLKLGSFIESSEVWLQIYYFLSTFLTFYLFVCASTGKFKRKWYELIYIAVAVIINRLVTDFLPELCVHTSTSLMFLLALLCKSKMQYAVPAFVIYGYLSQFLFSIRGFETIILKINIASGFVLGLECYVWLFLFSLLFYLKESKKNGKYSTTIPKQVGREV